MSMMLKPGSRSTRKSTISMAGKTKSVARITSTGKTFGPSSLSLRTKAISISMMGEKNVSISSGVSSGRKRSFVIALKSGSEDPAISCIGLDVSPTL